MKKQTSKTKAAPLTTPAQLVGTIAAIATAAPVVPVKAKPVKASVKYELGPKPYRVTAPHNVERWEATVKAIADGGGFATSEVLRPLSGPTPDTMLGYLVRGGHLAVVVDE